MTSYSTSEGDVTWVGLKSMFIHGSKVSLEKTAKKNPIQYKKKRRKTLNLVNQENLCKKYNSLFWNFDYNLTKYL